MAAVAPALAQRCGSDTSAGGADLLVEREEVARYLHCRGVALLLGFSGVLVDLCPRGVSGPLNGEGVAADRLTLGGQFCDPPLGVLELFHDLELDVLERRLPPGQRGDLALQLLELPRRGYLAGVEPVLVAVLSLAHLVDIGVGPLLLLLQVRHLGLGRDLGIAQPAVLGGQGIQFGDLRQRTAPVCELVEFRVQRLELE